MKQRRQVGILFILIVLAAIVWLWNFRGKRVVTADAPQNLKDDPIIQVENPHIRMEQIKRTQSAEYKGSGRNPFSYEAAPVAAKTIQSKKPSEFMGPKDQPPPPPPPPLVLPPNVKFYGFGTVPNGTSRRAFLHDGEDVYVLGEGDVLLKRFRIIRIGNANLEFEEISTGRIGTAPLVEEQAGAPASPGAPPQ
jgi:hypothetical protein